MKKFFSVSPADRRLLVEAALWLGFARLMIVLMPFQRITHHLRLRQLPVNGPADGEAGADVERVGWAVRALGARVPWMGSCLAQALAGSLLLRRRGVGSILYLGVGKDGVDLAAHAWLRCGDAVLTGASEMARFRPISAFGPNATEPQSSA